MKTLIAVFALCAVFECAVQAQTAGTFPLTGNVLMTNSTATLSGVVIGPLSPAKIASAGILFMPTFSAAGAGTSNVVFTLDLSPDGLTYSTTGPVTFTAACNGTNTVTHWENIFAENLPNTQYIKLTSISTTQTNTVTVTSVKYFMVSP